MAIIIYTNLEPKSGPGIIGTEEKADFAVFRAEIPFGNNEAYPTVSNIWGKTTLRLPN